jgi:1-deoxy-D-xylulose-5-phosphate synthase
MKEGSGMVTFAERYPNRFFDVAIAEQHALTFAAGLACENKKPVVAIYSTFLQRAYDQLIHDIALQNLDVTFAVDRAGLVGPDGPTHAGVFDLSFLRCIPNIVIATPSNENECHQLLSATFDHKGPAIVRYPRGKGAGTKINKDAEPYRIGEARLLQEGEQLCILNFGPSLEAASQIAQLENYGLCDMRWVKPLDKAMIQAIAQSYTHIVTIEENMKAGGAGSAVQEYILAENIPLTQLIIGIPDRNFEEGSRSQLLSQAGLDQAGIQTQIQNWLKQQTNNT